MKVLQTMSNYFLLRVRALSLRMNAGNCLRLMEVNMNLGSWIQNQSFHISANSSGSRGLDISCIFLLVFALTFFANLPAFFLLSKVRICKNQQPMMILLFSVENLGNYKYRWKIYWSLPDLGTHRMDSHIKLGLQNFHQIF